MECPLYPPYPPYHSYLPWKFFGITNLDWLPLVYGMSSLSSLSSPSSLDVLFSLSSLVYFPLVFGKSSLSSLESVVLPLLIAFRRLWSAFQQETPPPTKISIASAAIKQKKCGAEEQDGIPQPGAAGAASIICADARCYPPKDRQSVAERTVPARGGRTQGFLRRQRWGPRAVYRLQHQQKRLG